MSYSSRAYLAHCEQQQAEAEGYEANNQSGIRLPSTRRQELADAHAAFRASMSAEEWERREREYQEWLKFNNE